MIRQVGLGVSKADRRLPRPHWIDRPTAKTDQNMQSEDRSVYGGFTVSNLDNEKSIQATKLALCETGFRNENSVLTLEAINETIRVRLPEKPPINSRTVGKMLDRMLYTRKLIRQCPAQRYRIGVIEWRHEYTAWFLERGNKKLRDGRSFNIRKARCHGWLGRGERAYRQIFGQRKAIK